MKHVVAVTCTLLALNFAQAQTPSAAQGAVPIVTLPAASARSASTVATVMGIHELADGKVLVNDAGHLQLKVFDPTLSTATVVTDSTPGTSNSYGRNRMPLIPFRGDSSLFPDYATRSMLVLDGGGQVVRVIALPNVSEFPAFISTFSGVDPQGRLVYRGPYVAA